MVIVRAGETSLYGNGECDQGDWTVGQGDRTVDQGHWTVDQAFPSRRLKINLILTQTIEGPHTYSILHDSGPGRLGWTDTLPLRSMRCMWYTCGVCSFGVFTNWTI